MYQGKYIDGKQAGTWIHWFPDGNIRSQSRYKNGKRHGVSTDWYPNGKMNSEVSYSQGKSTVSTGIGIKMANYYGHVATLMVN